MMAGGRMAVEIQHLWKTFQIPHERRTTLFENLTGFFRPNSYETITILKDVNLQVERGECIGIVGDNGSGKSTLLKIIANILRPTRGAVKVYGKLTPFLELGVGFQSDLTVRENIRVYATIMGLPQKIISERITEVIKFAGLERFEDMKLKNLSSGMQVRLAFSTAIQTDPAVLLVDEVLAVGDMEFQQKCFDVFNRYRREGVTILFVSHDLDAVRRFCDRTLLLGGGEQRALGETEDVLDKYIYGGYAGNYDESANKRTSSDPTDLKARTEINKSMSEVALLHSKINECKAFFAPPLWAIPEADVSIPLSPPAYWAGLHDPIQSDAKIQAALKILEIGAEVEAEKLKSISSMDLKSKIIADTAPLPITKDRDGYYGDYHLAYWMMGLGDFMLIKEIANGAGVPLRSGTRFFDFGCASGRVLRQFIFQGEEINAYGCDIGQNNIRWIRKHLPPKASVFQNTILPSLPIPDNFIDFIYAGSAFTQIGNFEEAWLLELRRILRPNGVAFVTVSTDRTWALLADPQHFLTRYLVDTPHRCEELPDIAITDSFFQSPMPEERITMANKTMEIGNLNLFHSKTYIRQHWSKFFHIDKILEKMHGNHRDGIVLRKLE
jgi:ABC-type polysaccharide/polyol phosphate transport system ATPase subunit/SAM-dependent methyltransferase